MPRNKLSYEELEKEKDILNMVCVGLLVLFVVSSIFAVSFNLESLNLQHENDVLREQIQTKEVEINSSTLNKTWDKYCVPDNSNNCECKTLRLKNGTNYTYDCFCYATLNFKCFNADEVLNNG